jgi:hypothetical protein
LKKGISFIITQHYNGFKISHTTPESTGVTIVKDVKGLIKEIFIVLGYGPASRMVNAFKFRKGL